MRRRPVMKSRTVAFTGWGPPTPTDRFARLTAVGVGLIVLSMILRIPFLLPTAGAALMLLGTALTAAAGTVWLAGVIRRRL